MRIALLNLRFSPNLGDVLLCECLEFGIKKAQADLDVVQIDITGRQNFSPASPRRLAAMSLLQKLPAFVRRKIATVVLGRSLRRVMPLWHSQFLTINAAVLGGGNLLADADLNFPLKIAAILSVVASRGIPAAVHAVGVSDNWSKAGERLFRTALKSVRLAHVAVRDQHSKDIWSRRLNPIGIASPSIVRDPGLLAAECYPSDPRPRTQRRRVGICMTHPVALAYHADEHIPDPAALTDWFRSLVTAFTDRGDAVFLFTTGSPEDEIYLDGILASFAARAGSPGSVERIPRFASAGGLATFVSSLDIALGHRLHACIAAYAFGVPNIGFTWDQKMLSFFNSVGRDRYLVSAVSVPVADVMALAEQTLAEGIDSDVRASVVAETHRDIRKLLHNVIGA